MAAPEPTQTDMLTLRRPGNMLLTRLTTFA